MHFTSTLSDIQVFEVFATLKLDFNDFSAYCRPLHTSTFLEILVF